MYKMSTQRIYNVFLRTASYFFTFCILFASASAVVLGIILPNSCYTRIAWVAIEFLPYIFIYIYMRERERERERERGCLYIYCSHLCLYNMFS